MQINVLFFENGQGKIVFPKNENLEKKLNFQDLEKRKEYLQTFNTSMI